MQKIFTLLTALIISLTVASQTQIPNGTVKGSVNDEKNRPIEAASVSLLKATDSSLAKMTVSNKEGIFMFENISEGKYFVSITAIGHSKSFSEPFALNTANNSIALKTISLQAKAKDLSGVTITASKPLIEQKIDRTVVNVDAAVTNAGATALEVLEKSPGITVDKDGNISLKGKQGVIIMLDGKPSYLSGAELVNLLRNMNANQLEQIEIMTNPPAKYDAAGNSGIINIKTKKINYKDLMVAFPLVLARVHIGELITALI